MMSVADSPIIVADDRASVRAASSDGKPLYVLRSAALIVSRNAPRFIDRDPGDDAWITASRTIAAIHSLLTREPNDR